MTLITCLGLQVPTRLTPHACKRHQQRSEKYRKRRAANIQPTMNGSSLASLDDFAPATVFCPVTCPRWGQPMEAN